MTEPVDKLRITLRENGYSLTAPRQIVFAALQNQEPQTIRQLVTACSSQIDRASVYRTFQLFEKLNIVQRLQIGWKYKIELSDEFSRHHHHLSCLVCGAVVPFKQDEILEKRLYKLSKIQGFKPQDHQLEIRGVCQNCQD
ncbi:MAG: Fur family transcriptional regulator [Candidatus Saccharimonadales bacterium]